MFAKIFKRTKEAPTAVEGGNGHHPIIHLDQIIKTYHNPAGDFPVLKGINADFYPGEFVGIIGRSGSGKSTLINMITGIDRPTSGEVYVNDTPVHKLSEGQMAIWRGRTVGIVFQFFQLLPTLTLLENIMLPMDFCHSYAPRARKERAMRLLELVDMQEHANKLPTAISGGQQQRVAIARALANDPPILLADEPTGNLDSRTAESIFSLFENLIAEGKTIVMVTHDSSLAKRVSRTLLLADGEVVNQWVFKALPSLPYPVLMEATRQVETLKFAPGQEIIRQGEESEHFYIVTSGVVEIALKRPGVGSDVVVEHMVPGDFFGEVEIMQGGTAIATARAGETAPVELLALDREPFLKLLSASQVTRDVIDRIVSQRKFENVSSRRMFK
jgi:ABC-type lipoprotein export system ATPase subunit